jgi:hypothetical protein
MKRFIAGRVEVCLGYDFEEMNKYDAIEKCKELGDEWRLPNENEIRYICGNLAYCGSFDFWTSTSTIGNLVTRRKPGWVEPVYWIGNPENPESAFVYDCQYMDRRCFQILKKSKEINCVFLAVRDI